MTPKQQSTDLVAKAAQERERRLALLDQKTETQEASAGLTSDLRYVYGSPALSMVAKLAPSSNLASRYGQTQTTPPKGKTLP